jgi:beta-galactosidase/beta-glucuronidase
MGLDRYYGPVWYRQSVKAPAVPAGKKVYLWVSATDGKCRVLVNGIPVSSVNDKGETVVEPEGYCQPFSFDITAALKPGSDNQVTLVGTRTFLNEQGTGGLLGPVMLYCEK